ncbi:hypothetical protein JW921_07515 [Candidatus Fermentibacterales bacterium]|nr:hypothetical protein [Candidatus Fermentibacterales bacterium]
MGLPAAALLTLTLSFADALYDGGDYGLAALEYSRVLYESGDTLGQPEEALRLARCLHALGRYQESLTLYSLLESRLQDPDSRALAAMGAGAVYADLGFHGRSIELYEEAARTATGEDLVFRAELLGALTPVYDREWSLAVEGLGELEEEWPGSRGQLAGELRGIAARGDRLPGRSPFWCGLASAILPGSGQMICGHVKDGLMAFGMTAAAGALLYAAVDEDNLSTSMLMGWLTFSFYGANVYGGARAAEYYNVARRREVYTQIRDRLERWPGD